MHILEEEWRGTRKIVEVVGETHVDGACHVRGRETFDGAERPEHAHCGHHGRIEAACHIGGAHDAGDEQVEATHSHERAPVNGAARGRETEQLRRRVVAEDELARAKLLAILGHLDDVAARCWRGRSDALELGCRAARRGHEHWSRSRRLQVKAAS